MSVKVFIDGKEGTTGLKIYERFGNRSDIEVLLIDDEKRKDNAERQKMINASDYTFLCLPDAAAVEAVSLCTNPHTRIIDASTAHRTNPDWAYGFPELSPAHRAKIARSKRVAVPGCYASGFASIVYPLTALGIMPPDYPVTVHAVSGYSGAGKKAIAQYQATDLSPYAAADSAIGAPNAVNAAFELASPRLYALTQEHKHLREMQAVSGLSYKPIFSPYICNYFSGMSVSVPIFPRLLSKPVTPASLQEAFARYYAGASFIEVAPLNGAGLDAPFIAANTLSGTNRMQIFVYGNDERIAVTSRFDNLGKGASGAAVQCLNIMMGIDEKTGL